GSGRRLGNDPALHPAQHEESVRRTDDLRTPADAPQPSGPEAGLRPRAPEAGKANEIALPARAPRAELQPLVAEDAGWVVGAGDNGSPPSRGEILHLVQAELLADAHDAALFLG